MEEEYGEGFEDTEVRNRFIRKVYSIIFMQLAFTTTVVAAFVFVDGAREYIRSHPFLLYVALAAFTVVYFLIACPCCHTLRRTFPINLILLIILTVAMSFLAGATASRYAPYSVFGALCATMVITAGLTIFAIQTRLDFTSCGGCICLLSLIFMASAAVVSVFFFTSGFNRYVDMILSIFGCILTVIYIIYFTQLIIGGKHRSAEISPEDYILAAVLLYTEIVELFLYLLRIFGEGGE